MPAMLATTINKIQSVPNLTNSAIINKSYQHMNDSNTYAHHQNNILKLNIFSY
jgi:hypothetical protein